MSAQTGWRWCDKCQGMFFSENPSHGVCAADNYPRDDHASGHYVIQFGDAVAGAQGHWFDPKVPQESQIRWRDTIRRALHRRNTPLPGPVFGQSFSLPKLRKSLGNA